MTDEQKEKLLNVIELSTGVKLRGKSMPPGVFINLSVKNPPPLPPTYKVGEGEKATTYTNPDDPGYIEAHKYWKEEQSKDLLNGMIIFGTDVHSVPKGFPKVESDDWIDELEVMGIETFPDNSSWRRLWWTLSKAAPISDDWEKIQEVVGRLSGVPEDDVDAAANFPKSK